MAANYDGVTRKVYRPRGVGRSPARSVRVRPELVDAVTEVAEDRSVGSVVSEALAEWLERRQGTAA